MFLCLRAVYYDRIFLLTFIIPPYRIQKFIFIITKFIILAINLVLITVILYLLLKYNYSLELLAIISSEILLGRSEEHTSELQSHGHLVCRILFEKKDCYI